MKEFFGFGGYGRDAEGYFSWQHLVFVSALMLIMLSLALILGFKNKNKEISAKNKVLIWAAVLIDSLELFKILIFCLRSGDPMDWIYELPLFLCSIQLITIPLAAFIANKVIDYNYMFLVRGDGTPYDILYNIVGGNQALYPLGVVALFLVYISAFYLTFYLLKSKKKEKIMH